MIRSSDKYEELLETRFNIARQIVGGRNGGQPLSQNQLDHLCKVSAKTHQRDVRRARDHQTFSAWRPARRGPRLRRISKRLYGLIEARVYEWARQKFNLEKQARDIFTEAEGLGFPVQEQSSESTIKRVILDIRRANPAHFAVQEFGRIGRHRHELQKGSLTASHPLEIVCIDATRLDAKTLEFEGEEFEARPWFTKATDIYSGVILAGLLTYRAPSASTIALTMAMMVSDKRPLLETYGLDFDWECAGIPYEIRVDCGKEFDRRDFEWICKQYDIRLVLGPAGVPHRRGKEERGFRSLNSDIHTWPGTTLSNPQDLKRHGGPQPAELTFYEARRALYLAILEYNHESYNGYEIPRFAKWREAANLPEVRSRQAADPVHTYIDFLPMQERVPQFSGIDLQGCRYSGSVLADLRFSGVKQVQVHFDPMEMRYLYVRVADARRHVAIKRFPLERAPREIELVELHNRNRRRAAKQKRDARTLIQILKAKRSNPFDIGFEELANDLAALPALPNLLGPPTLADIAAAARQFEGDDPEQWDPPDYPAKLS